MMRRVLTYILCGVLLSPLSAQIMIQQPGQFNNTVQMVPGAFPTTLTCLIGFASTCLYRLTNTNPGLAYSPNDPFLCEADITATGQTINFQDANGIPWIVAGATLPASGTTPTGWVWTAGPDVTACRRFPGGIYVQAGSSGVTGSVTVKFNK